MCNSHPSNGSEISAISGNRLIPKHILLRGLNYQNLKFTLHYIDSKLFAFSLCIVGRDEREESDPEAVVLLDRLGLIPRHRADFLCFDYESAGMS